MSCKVAYGNASTKSRAHSLRNQQGKTSSPHPQGNISKEIGIERGFYLLLPLRQALLRVWQCARQLPSGPTVLANLQNQDLQYHLNWRTCLWAPEVCLIDNTGAGIQQVKNSV